MCVNLKPVCEINFKIKLRRFLLGSMKVWFISFCTSVFNRNGWFVFKTLWIKTVHQPKTLTGSTALPNLVNRN